MKEVFPTAEMVQTGFTEASTDCQTMKTDIAEVRADLGHLTSTVEDLRERVAVMPTTHDMEAILERTYGFNQMKAEHKSIKHASKINICPLGLYL